MKDDISNNIVFTQSCINERQLPKCIILDELDILDLWVWILFEIILVNSLVEVQFQREKKNLFKALIE